MNDWHETTVRVRYAETDKMGVVYYANYLVWFEVGRTDWLRETGWTYRAMEAGGFQLPVIAAHCEYQRSARYDDELEILERLVEDTLDRLTQKPFPVVDRHDDGHSWGTTPTGGH